MMQSATQLAAVIQPSIEYIDEDARLEIPGLGVSKMWLTLPMPIGFGFMILVGGIRLFRVFPAWLAVFLLLIAGPAAAQDVRINVFEHGIYTAETVRTERLPNGFDSNIVQNICHVMTTEAVPARMVLQFGMRYRVEGEPVGAPIVLQRITRFPVPLRPPTGASAQSVSEYATRIAIGATSYAGYGFDHDWELVAGTWILELWWNGRMLAQQRFEIGIGDLPADRPRSNENCFSLSS